MLKLNLYKKSKKRLELYNSNRFSTEVLVFKSIQNNFFFNTHFSCVKRMGVLFFLYHYSKRRNLFQVNHLKSQCLLSWRTGSVYSFFRLTRSVFRERLHFGLLKGIRKSSW